MTLPPDLRDGLLQSIPSLRAFAISLTGNIDQADDLVQEAMVRGLTYINQFQPGTNIQAWLFTILRNQFHTFYRKRRREVEDPDGGTAAHLAVPPEQDGHVDVEDLKAALAQLPIAQREALLLVGHRGFHMRRLLRFAERGLERSRAGSTVPEPDLQNCLGLKAQRTWGLTGSLKPRSLTRHSPSNSPHHPHQLHVWMAMKSVAAPPLSE